MFPLLVKPSQTVATVPRQSPHESRKCSKYTENMRFQPTRKSDQMFLARELYLVYSNWFTVIGLQYCLNVVPPIAGDGLP